MELYNTTKLVKAFLEAIPETRGDDYLLWLKVLEFEAVRKDHIFTFAQKVTLDDFLRRAKYSKYPHFETVSRIRRKLQEKYPDLRATAETQAARAEQEEIYREYARQN